MQQGQISTARDARMHTGNDVKLLQRILTDGLHARVDAAVAATLLAVAALVVRIALFHSALV